MTKGQTALERSLQAKTSNPLYYGTVHKLLKWGVKHTVVSIWTWMFPGTHIEDARCFLMIPVTPLDGFITYTMASQWSWAQCTVLCCDYRGHSGSRCNHKVTFQLSTVLCNGMSKGTPQPLWYNRCPSPPSPTPSLPHWVAYFLIIFWKSWLYWYWSMPWLFSVLLIYKCSINIWQEGYW